MAEAIAQDVVNEAQSMGETSLIGVSGNTFTSNTGGEGEEQLTLEVDKTGVSHVATSSFQENSITEPGATQPNHVISYLTTNRSELFDSQSNDPGNLESSNSLAIDQGLVNGVDSASFAGSEDAGYQNLVGTDDSVTSDTDINRVEGLEQVAGQTNRRERSNSIKKPATSFKTVSVTKNFLAKSGATTTTTTSKLTGERVPAGNQSTLLTAQSARPRLVAKTGRDARSLNTGSGVGTSSGPDASKVWNRNRPTPPAPPKQFTDEELKQQYGIHMATRLQADESGKESKWADIDDDEDDWAPETVQWMDGTKSTLLQTETQPPAMKPNATTQPIKDVEEASEEPPQPAQTSSSSSISSIGKTILRPGAARVASQTKPGLVLKTVPEKPAQPEKPVQTSFSKSPWAQLPPVDKASPITFYPPTTTSQPMMSLQHEQAIQDEERQQVQSPAREIAADDFDRSWRESGDRSGRELFNSQSGRYEPVKNLRRSSRQEGGFRPPSVLQRPSQQGPAEPSPAFQARESRGWGQRRDSSSHGPNQAPFERRPSSEVDSRGQSQANKSFRSPPPPPGVTPDAAVEPSFSERGENTETLGQTQAPPNAVQGQEQPPVNSTPDEDPRVIQQQLMRERIERNRKRKQEEEAREEAERKERIRLKMEALGPASPSVKQTEPVESKPGQPSEIAESEGRRLADETQAEDVRVTGAQEQKSADPRPAPVKSEAPQQKESPIVVAASHSEPPATNRTQPVSASMSPMETSKATLSDTVTSSAKNQEVQLPGLGQPIPADRQSRSWNRVPQNLEPPSHWGPKPLSQAPGSVWGPWTTDRQLGNGQLGNGAFETEMSRAPSSQIAHNNQLGPGPLRPPSIPSFETANQTPSPSSHIPARHDGIPQSSSPLPPNVMIGSPFPQAPFHQSQMRTPNDQAFHRQPSHGAPDMAHAKRAWHNFATHAATDDAAMREQAEREWAAKQAEEERDGVQQEYQPVFRETFRKTTPGESLGQRRVVSVAQGVHDPNNQIPYGQRSASLATPLQQTTNGRASRFFGPTADPLPPVTTVPVFEMDMPPHSPPSPSPPPPESVHHPVHGAHGKHPLVNIPKVLKVKLPPAPSSSPQKQEPVQMPPLLKYRSGHQPIVSQTAWQDRFNGLFGRTSKTTQLSPNASSAPTQLATQPPGAPAAPITSSTRDGLDEPWAANSATVSLPHGTQQPNDPLDPEAQKAETKPTEEELVDEREFGSSPTVRLFKGRHPSENRIMTDCPAFHRGLVGDMQIVQFEKTNKDFAASAGILSFEYLDQELFHNSGLRIKIHLKDKPTTMKVLPRKATSAVQSRKPKPRHQPKKPHLTNKGARPAMHGPTGQLQESSTNGNKKASTSVSSPKPDGQKGLASENKPEQAKTVFHSSGAPVTGESTTTSQPEKRKTSWAKPPRNQHRHKQNAIQA